MRTIDDLVSMAMFARVVEAKSFTAAAAQLGLSKSVLSKRVAALEERLQTPLLHRTTRRLSMTTEGSRVHEHCLAMLRAADDVSLRLDADAHEPRGVLRITCSSVVATLFLNRAVNAFVRKYPAVSIELSAAATIVDLVAERFDIAIRMTPTLENSSLIARKIGSSKKAICASPDYLRRCGIPKTPDQLRSHACLRFSPIRAEVEWRFGDEVVPVSGPLTSDNTDTLKEAALEGIGLVNLPAGYLQTELDSGRLVRVLEDFPQPARGIYAVYLKNRVVPAKVRRFIDSLV